MAIRANQLVFIFLISFLFVESSALSEVDALFSFKKSIMLDGNNALDSWGGVIQPCTGDFSNWAGVLCEKDVIWGIQLEDMGLSGTVNLEALVDLPKLRSLSLMNNNFACPLPPLKKLRALKSLYLSNNQFSGEIEGEEFHGMKRLKKIHLEHNNFTGEIPASLTTLPKLLEIKLNDNQFSGPVPQFKQNLEIFDISNNALTGPIPDIFSPVDPASFSGNKGLCGKPLSNACESAPVPSPAPAPAPAPVASLNQTSGTMSPKRASSKVGIVIIAVIAAAAILAAVLVIFMVRHKKQKQPHSIEAGPSTLETKTGTKDTEGSPRGSPTQVGVKKATELSFVRDDTDRFDLQDLLKASAEILGSGCFGSSYKAALLTGQVMVAKRFKQMNNAGREDFLEHMRRIGRLMHPNLLPLVAYYYRKEEKLLITNYVSKGSLAAHLRGHQSMGQPSLDWPTRLKIVKGVARGLQYLYKELTCLIAPHGHLKSSNILLNENMEPLLTDYGLIPLINQESAQALMVVYKSPEYLQHGRVTKKTDIWALGLLILEILTGKLPANFVQKGKGSEGDLVAWVNSVFQGEGPGEVFDKEMGDARDVEEEMVELLKIALSCCEVDVEKRLDLREAVERIEELGKKEGDDDFYSTIGSEADVHSIRGRSIRGKSSDFNFL